MPTGSKYSLPLNLKNDYHEYICLLTSQIMVILLGMQIIVWTRCSNQQKGCLPETKSCTPITKVIQSY